MVAADLQDTVADDIRRRQVLAVLARLVESLLGLELGGFLRHQSRRKMAEALVASFKSSDSYATAKRTVTNLQLVKEWPENLIERVRRATAENSQVAKAYGVPRRANSLLAAIAGP